MSSMADPVGRPTSRTVALLAGVSQQTVSNVINHPDRVAPETLRRVHEAMDDAGFVIDSGARQLRTGTSALIAVIVPDTEESFWGDIVRGVNVAADAETHSLLFGTSDDDPDKLKRLVQVFASYRPRGLIVAPTGDDVTPIQRVAEHGLRVVYLDRIPRTDAPSVQIDHVEGAKGVIRHLHELGHDSILMVNGPRSIDWCAERYEGAAEEAKRLGASLGEFTVPDLTDEQASLAADSIRSDGASGPTAVFCVTDRLAAGFARGAVARGLRIPEDVSLVGWDDSIIAQALSPRLTSVRQDPFDVGVIAARMLFADGQPGREIIIPTLVVRESTAPPARP